MSESETEMILAVVPQNDSIVKETLYERSGAKTCCDMKKNGETIQLQISGKTVELYEMCIRDRILSVGKKTGGFLHEIEIR